MTTKTQHIQSVEGITASIVRKLGYLAIVRAYMEAMDRMGDDEARGIAGVAENMLECTLKCPDGATGSRIWDKLVANLEASIGSDWNEWDPLCELAREAERAGDAEVALVMETVGCILARSRNEWVW